MISTKQENPMPTTFGTSLQVIPSGRPIGGKPPWTAPTIATPCDDALSALDTTIDTTTATTAPGTTGRKRLNPTMMASAPIANATVHRLAAPTWVIVHHCCSNQLPEPLGIPSMSGI